ncbi:hypothetical protein C1645_771194 [Glomus cerebriforme]|uniref:Uncharacterized protein n=1 Tax=Glomus cerebriforme TaxID=658196 RepID=A0A397SW50_9GLOM|nr:hypothetical protein C1645_771194 [Glomus cerebriforme]
MTRQINSCIKIPIILLLLYFSNIIYSYRTIKLYEDLSNGPLYPVDAISFQDSSILTIRLASNCSHIGNSSPLNVFPIRSLYPNGTLIPANVIYLFADINFCPINRISILALPDDFLFISYLRQEQVNQVRIMGMISQLDGTIIDSGIELSDSIGFDITSTTSYPSQIKINNDVEDGELLFTITYDNLNINWRRFEWDNKGNRLINMTQGIFGPGIPSSESYQIDSFQTFDTLDGGFGLAYSISLPSRSAQQSTFSHSIVYITFLHKSAPAWTSPTIIYEISGAIVTIKSCASSIDTSLAGNTCFIIITPQSPQQLQYSWRIIKFLSVGSILSYQNILNSEIRFEKNRNVVLIYTDVLPLNYDGFCMIGIRQDNFITNLQGSLYNITGDQVVKVDDWGIPLISLTSRVKYNAFNNDTIWAVIPGEDNSGTFWYILSNDLYRGNIGYENKQILNTIPSINATIPTDIKTITIMYREPIVLSTGFISIYQRSYNNNDPTNYTDFLRQKFSASSQYVNYVNGTSNTEVVVQILSSTFSRFNSNYYITIEDDFVRNQDFNEPLKGIESGIWMIKTNLPENQQFTDNKDVLLRLDAYGTLRFQNMSSSEQDNFFDNLLLSFSQSVPVPLERLYTSKRYQYDGSSGNDDLPILIKIQLKASRNKENMNTEQILNDMDTLVKNKYVTQLINFGNSTDLLDSNYGVKEIGKKRKYGREKLFIKQTNYHLF